MSSIAPNNDHGNDLQNGSNSSQQANNEAEYRRSASTPQNNAAASNTGQVTPLFFHEWKEPVLDTYTDLEAIPEPFPLWELPDDVQGAIEEVAEITQAPIPLIFASCMSIISASVQGLVNATYPTRNGSKSIPCSLFFLTLADSGERKTTVDSYFKKSILEWEKQKKREYEDDMKTFNGIKKAWEIKGKMLEKQMQEISNPNSLQINETFIAHHANVPMKPTMKKLIIMDATTEAFMKQLQSYPVKAQLSSEGGTIFGSNAMGIDNIMKTLGQYNELWDGNGVQRDRMSEESNVSVGEVRVTLGVSVQPSVFKQFMNNTKKMGKDSGFLARFLLSQPISTKGTRSITLDKPKILTPYLDNYHKRIDNLLNMKIKFNDEDKSFLCTNIIMDKEAESLWEDFYNCIEEQQGEGENYDHISGFASKCAEHLVRLATCLHIFCDKSGQNSLINKEIINSSIEIMYWYIREQKRFDNVASTDDKTTNLEYLLNKIKKHCNNGVIKDCDLRRRVFKYRHKTKEYRNDLAWLEQNKCIKQDKQAGGLFIFLNPKV